MIDEDASLEDTIRQRLCTDARWRVFVGDGRIWICPCCHEAVEVTSPDLEAVFQGIYDHCELVCTAFHDGAMPFGGETDLRALQSQCDTRFRYQHDPAWQVRDRQKRWWCPGCLTAMSVAENADEAVATIDAHRQVCADLTAGCVHELDAVRGALISDDYMPGDAVAGSASLPTANLGTDSWLAKDDDAGQDLIASPAANEELVEARALQLNLMHHPPEVPGYRIATRYQACSEVSGDFNQFVQLDDGRLAFAQGDISGHGVRAGMLMAIANKLVELYARVYDDPRQVVIQVHRAMADDLGGRSFLTMTYCVLDPASRVVRWVRAGHNQTLVLRAQDQTVETLVPGGMAVGLPVHEAFAHSLELAETTLVPGDCFVLFTDGISEAMDDQRREFGLDKVVEVVAAHGSAGAEAVVAGMFTAVAAHCGAVPQGDDLSMIALAVDTG